MSGKAQRATVLLLSMNALRSLLATVSLLLSTAAFAGPPFLTDDPEPVKYGHWEINYAVSKIWREGSTSTALPAVDINYGILPDVQVHAQPRFSREQGADGTHTGIDDTEVGIKYRFLSIENGATSFMAGIYPMLQLPTGDRALGATRGKLQSFLPLWAQFSHSGWTLYGGVGYRINQGLDNRNSVFTGATTLYQLSPGLQLGGEIFHETADAKDSSSTAGFNLGGIANLAPHYNLLFSAGRNLRNSIATNHRSLFLALQVLQ